MTIIVGRTGGWAYRSVGPLWSCYSKGMDDHYFAVVDDYGNLRYSRWDSYQISIQ